MERIQRCTLVESAVSLCGEISFSPAGRSSEQVYQTEVIREEEKQETLIHGYLFCLFVSIFLTLSQLFIIEE